MNLHRAVTVNHPWYRFHVSAPLVDGFELVSFERHWGATTFWYRQVLEGSISSPAVSQWVPISPHRRFQFARWRTVDSLVVLDDVKPMANEPDDGWSFDPFGEYPNSANEPIPPHPAQEFEPEDVA